MIDKVKNWLVNINKENLLWGISGIIAVLLIVSFFRGYNPLDLFLIGRKGTLTLELPLSQTNVFIDEEKKLTTIKENEVLKITLSPKKHSVIISHDGYFPWAKDIELPNNGEVKLAPIFVSINTTGQIITKDDPEYWDLRKKIISNVPPTKENPEISKDGTTKLWLDDNAIWVSNLSGIEKVLQPDTIIRSVSFYRDRADVVIFATSNAIYAIEVSKSGKQNFMPIYKGVSPSFIKTDPGFIYIWDNQTLMQVII